MTRVDKIREVRYLRFVEGVPIREICRRVQLARNTVKRIIRSDQTEFTYQRTNTCQPVTGGIRDTVKEWIKEEPGGFFVGLARAGSLVPPDFSS